MPRWMLAIVAASASLGVASAQPPEADAPGALAILIRNPSTETGAPPYALTDQFGRIQRLVEPSPSVNLKRYVGQRVRIRHDTGRTLLASQLELPGAFERSARAEPARELEPVSPASFRSPRRGRTTVREDKSVLRSRRYDVVPAQATEPDAKAAPSIDPGDRAPLTDVEPIYLDEEGEARDQVRGLVDEMTQPMEDGADALEPIPAGEPVEDSLPYNDYYADDYDVGERLAPISEVDEDCPHCRAKQQERIVKSSACPECGTQREACPNCGKDDRWCGPTCNPPSQRGVYGRAEYLLWWFDGMNTPPLATTNSLGDVPILGRSGTSVVYGGDLLDDARNGFRLTLGGWLDNRRDIAIEGDWTVFETESESFAFTDPTGTQILGRPFYNIVPVFGGVEQPPADDVQLVSFPSQATGALSIVARSEFDSFGLRLRTGICCREIGGCGPCNSSGCNNGSGPLRGLLKGQGSRPTAISRIDFLLGYRYTQLEEQLLFGELITQPSSSATVAVNEWFNVDNDFHGVDLGFVYDWQAERWGVELVSKIALGGTTQRVEIAGTNTIGAAGAGVTTGGGLLAQTSNIGVYQRDRFSALPELSARLSYRVTPQFSLSAGYTLLYWANVVRPGDQIDFSVDGRLASGALTTPTTYSHPRFDFEETSLWAHGFNFGADYRY